MRQLIKNTKLGKPSSKADEIAASLEEAYLLQARQPGMKTKFSFAPSTIGYGHGECPRYWVLAFRGADFDEVVDAPGIANMAYGTDAHERIQKLFESMGTLVASEVKINLKDPPIFGFLDVMVRHAGDVVIGEIKTTRSEIFEHRKASGLPAPNHLLQLLIYMRATGKKEGFILYENKNDQTFLVIWVDMNESNEALLEQVLSWLREVYAAFLDDKLPENPYRSNSKVCKNCPINKWCFAQPAGDIKIEPMKV